MAEAPESEPRPDPTLLRSNAVTFLASSVFAFASDQITKYAVVTQLAIGDRIDVIDGFFAITHVRNPGMAFGLLRDFPEVFRLPFFGAVTFLAVLLVVSFYRKLAPGDRLSALSLGMILAGALGNLCDRVIRGEVVDFLHFRLWRNFSWPDFNLADSWIVIGVAFLFVELLALESDPEGSARR